MNSCEDSFINDQVYLGCFVNNLNEMRRAEILCDVVLRAERGTRRFSAHRSVLAASSSYFYNLYTGTSLTRYSRETVISGIQDSVLQTILDYIYSAKIQLSESNIEELLHASFFLGLESLKLECEKYLLDHLCVENCIEMIAQARLYSCDKLLKEGKRCLTDNFLEVQGSDAFFKMPAKELIDIVSDDDLNVQKEEQVYNAICSWVRFDVSTRRAEFSRLLGHVRLPFVSRKFLLGTIDRDPLVTSSSECKELVAEAFSFKMASHKSRRLLQNERTQRRWKSQLIDVIVLVGGFIEEGAQPCSHCFSPLTNKWYELSPLIDSRLNFGLARLHSWLFAVGGSSVGENMNILSCVERLDPKLNRWEKVSPLAKGRLNLESVELNGKLYVIGGVLGTNDQEHTMECYDHVTDSWTSLSPPRQMRYTHCAVSFNGHLFVIGGTSKHNKILSTVERYDPKQDKWSSVTSLNSPRSGACAVVLREKIYVMGGGSEFRRILSSCEVYDPLTKQWTFCKEMSTKRDRAEAAVFDGKIYVFGGSYGHVAVESVECYDPDSDEWTIVTELPYPRYGFRCAATVVSKDLVAEVSPMRSKTSSQEKLI